MFTQAIFLEEPINDFIDDLPDESLREEFDGYILNLDNRVVKYIAGEFRYFEPFVGMKLWVKELKAFYFFDGLEWKIYSNEELESRIDNLEIQTEEFGNKIDNLEIQDEELEKKIQNEEFGNRLEKLENKSSYEVSEIHKLTEFGGYINLNKSVKREIKPKVHLGFEDSRKNFHSLWELSFTDITHFENRIYISNNSVKEVISNYKSYQLQAYVIYQVEEEKNVN